MKIYTIKFNYLLVCKLDSENFIDEFHYSYYAHFR